jgi:serpin B
VGESGFEQGNAAFAQALYGKLAAGAKGNLFFSPSSISTALAMAFAGARGETAAQMAATLRFTVPPGELHAGFAAQTARLTAGMPKGPEIRIANRMWGQAGLPVEADFQKIAKDHYGAGWELADFKGAAEPARGKINQWVSDQTNAKIKDLLPPGSLTPLTRLVITNAIYFKGKWATPFDKEKTKSEPFTLAGGTTASVPMMRRVLRAGFAETADASVAELRYEGQGTGRKLSMVVIVPKAADGLGPVEQRIAAGGLGGYVSGLADEQVDVALPRFKMTSEHDLGGTLKTMGMPLAFDESRADFSGISKAERLYITKVAHKAFVEVNEEGTEAAAATGVVIGTKSMPPPPKVFRADRPFAFILRDATTGTVLFMGRVADPR